MPLFRSNYLSHARVEYHNIEPENLLLLERSADGGTTIRAAEDNLTRGQQRILIRYLWEEGFISDSDGFRDHPDISKEAANSYVRWVYDSAWPHRDRKLNFYMRRLICQILFGVGIVISLLIALCAF